MAATRLLERMREAIRLRQYSLRTQRSYLDWAKRFILFHKKRHPAEMGKSEVEAFLTHLAINRAVSPSTQNQALQALLFLYRQVLEIELPWLDDVVRAKPRRHLPVVLSREEVRAVLSHIDGNNRLPASLMYGSGLRVTECLRLRVGDLDFSRRTVRIHSGKGGKDRITVLPDNLAELLREQLSWVALLHKRDLDSGFGFAKLPLALQRKLGKSSSRLFWQFVFPSKVLSEDGVNVALSIAGMFIPLPSTRRLQQHRRLRSFPNVSPAIPCGIRSPRTCWNRARTSAPSRLCWDTAM